MASLLAAVKRYSGYTRFLAPYWAKYVDFVAAHPRTAAIVILVLAVLGIR